MQSINTYPLLRPVTAAQSRSSTIAYLRALTVTIWFGSLVVNFWWREQWDWSLDFAQQGVNLRDHYLIGLAIALGGHLTLGAPTWISASFRALSTPSGKLFTLFCLLMLAFAPFSASLRTSVIYACATWLVFLLCHLYWNSDYSVVRRVLVFSGMMLFVWFFALMLHHGMPRGFFGGIGGINRNSTSALGLAGMICCALSPRRSIRWGGIALCALFAVMVTSRGTMVAMGVFLAVYYSLYKGTIRAAWHAALAMFIVAVVLLASSFVQRLVLEDVMRLHDQNRGLGSGFTGRVESWQRGLEVFGQSPVIGHGFRASVGAQERGLGAHGGYINLLIDTGLVGTLLAVGTVIVEAIRRLNRAKWLRNTPTVGGTAIDLDETLRLNIVVCATMFTILTLWVYEPLYLNLGTVMSLVFFLMLGAPEFVADRQPSIATFQRSRGLGTNFVGRTDG